MSLQSLSEVRGALAGVARRFDPALAFIEECERVIIEASAITNIANIVTALAAARVAEGDRGGSGAGSAAQRVASTTGTTAHQTRRLIQTGKRLRKLDATREAAQNGELSPDKAEAVADAATADPDSEKRLLGAAASESVSELRDECAKVKARADRNPDATRQRIHRERSLRHWKTPDGVAHLHLAGPAPDVAEIRAALEPFIEAAFKAAREEGRRETFEAYGFDGAVAMARVARHGTPTTKRRRSRYHAIIRADLEALIAGTVEGEEICEIDGSPISVAALRDLLGDSIVHLVLTRGQDVGHVTYLGRGLSAAQHIAELWQNRRCIVEGCPAVLGLEDDHETPWAEHHTTTLANNRRECRQHHDLKTHEGWALVEGTGRRPMVPPDDPRHPRHARQPAAGA